MRTALKFSALALALGLVGFLIHQHYHQFGFEEVFLLVAATTALWAIFSVQVPQRTGLVIANVFGGHRDVGSGFHFMLRPLEWRDQEVELDKPEIRFLVRVMNANREFLSIGVDVGTQARVGYLFEHLRFPDRDREGAVQRRIEGLLTELIHHYPDPDTIVADREAIEVGLMLRFRNSYAGEVPLELYYGLSVNYIFLSRVVPSDVVQNSGDLKLVNKERCKALAVTMEGYDREIKRMRRKDKSLSYVRALEILMGETGSAPRKVVQVETGAGLASWLESLVPKRKE